MMRQKYVVSNIYVEDTQLQLLCDVKKQCNYCCQKVLNKVTILLLKGVMSSVGGNT